MSDHECEPPTPLSEWDHDEDWTCPTCGQEWFVGRENYCHSCRRSDGPVWEKFGVLDPNADPFTGFPRISVNRGGMIWGRGQS